MILTTLLLAGLPLVHTTADLAKLTDEDFRRQIANLAHRTICTS